MSTPRKPVAHRESAADNLGLVANGRAGDWEVAVDETTSGSNRWFLEIEGPGSYCSFEISSPSKVQEALEFLAVQRTTGILRPSASSHHNGKLVLGTDPKAPVTLLRDDEYADRFFLVIGYGSALVRVTIAGKDLKNVTEALRQAVEDIDEDN